MRKSKGLATNQDMEFNTLVTEADRDHKLFIDSFATGYEFKTLLRFMPNLSWSSVLDIGCGHGRFDIPIAKIAKNVVGIDTSKDSIRLLRAKAQKEHLRNISARVMDFHDLPNKKKFDYVLLVNVMHHVPKINDLLDKIKTVLRNTGTLVILEFNPLNPLYIPFLILNNQVRIHMNQEYFRSNIWTLRKTLHQAGYSLTGISRYGFLPTVLSNISPMFVKVNTALNSIPILNIFCAFHIVTCTIRKYE